MNRNRSPRSEESVGFDPEELGLINHIKSELQTLREEGRLTEEDEIENLVFEGGGVKGIAYIGALQVLQELGILTDANGNRRIKRIAGASAGAMLASLLAIGLKLKDIDYLLNQNIKGILEDHALGCCSLLPNLITKFGWNPGRRIERWFRQRFKELNIDSDITFAQLLERNDTELCIVSTNLNRLSADYLHAKTTPNMEIYKAVRMSMSLPFYFARMRYPREDYDESDISEKSCKCIRCWCCCCICGGWEKGSSRKDIYVDGGLVCNYPIHVFDGWWLSLEEKNHFVKKLRPFHTRIDELYDDAARFGTECNWKTLGLLLYSANEAEIFAKKLIEREASLFHRCKENNPSMPKQSELDKYAVTDGNRPSYYRLEDVQEILRNLDNTAKSKLLRRGGEVDFMKKINPNNDNRVDLNEILGYFRSVGVNLRTGHLGFERVNITKPSEYVSSLLDTLAMSSKRRFVKGVDVHRTIGINTHHVGTTNWYMDEADKKLLKKIFIVKVFIFAARFKLDVMRSNLLVLLILIICTTVERVETFRPVDLLNITIVYYVYMIQLFQC
ncbi:uncharacterized protein TRIADDRAFT_58860 [Trichoplax adhaerens]|uniref:PNPLA domain-containing protein n=1 Tax=Trichoplax adhaerens TaxID=10228 RepID=B3S3V5_TRIAD|nr:hypothetical protein TRIADDRAFT_58860 [Trichoplax adhaerens]EDV22531.1 hypothetical protein TRIADDRAFT_58860 [Trichoplax adhaerens]|eukprot:XP_002115075.1 hypothetical protein TRIADDRAFT_58860 [Trichoplax adhaerens]